MRKELGRCNLDSCLTLAGMTRPDLTEKTGHSRSQLAGYAASGKKRRVMNAETLFTIANAIDCRPEALYDLIDVPNPVVQKRQTKKAEL
jgi:DNA-binding Xre family transcriptional regulator